MSPVSSSSCQHGACTAPGSTTSILDRSPSSSIKPIATVNPVATFFTGTLKNCVPDANAVPSESAVGAVVPHWYNTYVFAGTPERCGNVRTTLNVALYVTENATEGSTSAAVLPVVDASALRREEDGKKSPDAVAAVAHCALFNPSSPLSCRSTSVTASVTASAMANVALTPRTQARMVARGFRWRRRVRLAGVWLRVQTGAEQRRGDIRGARNRTGADVYICLVNLLLHKHKLRCFKHAR